MSEDRIRHSKADDAEIVADKLAIAKREAQNALRQAERVRQMVLDVLDGKPFRLRMSTILELNRCAIEGLSRYAGLPRPAGVEIGASKHVPPDGHLVPGLLEDMCEYVSNNWEQRSAIHLASFVMWRLNWIHPFTDGNGRTSRAVSYLVLSAHIGAVLPGNKTIPEQIVANRIPYYDALEAADGKYLGGNTFVYDIVSEMEELLSAMLARQLKSGFDIAIGDEKDVSEEMIGQLGERARNSQALIDDADSHVRDAIETIKSGKQS